MSLGCSDLTVKQSTVTITLIMIGVIWPAQLALNNPWQLAVLTGPAIFAAAAVLVIIMTRATSFTMPMWIVFFTLLWLAAAGASSFSIGNPRALQVYGAVLLVFYLVAALAAASADRVRLVRLLIIGVAVGGMALMVISLAVEPFSLRRYDGVFNNPNNMGWFTAGLLHLVLGALYGNRLCFTRHQRYVLFAVLVLAAIFLLASNSRAALASVIASGGVLGLLLWSESINLRRGTVQRKGVQRLVVALVVALGAVVLAWVSGLLNEILEKFIETQRTGDVTQGRLGAWTASLQNWNWFGHGPNYADAIGRAGLVTGHSTWISQLSRYGLVNMLFFIGFLGAAAWWAWRAARRNSHPVAPVLLAVVIGYAGNATFETGTSTPGMWLTIILFAIGLQGLGKGREPLSDNRKGAA